MNLLRNWFYINKRSEFWNGFPEVSEILQHGNLRNWLTPVCYQVIYNRGWNCLALRTSLFKYQREHQKKKCKLTSVIKTNIANFNDSPILNQVNPKNASVSKRVESKISDGDVRDAVKLLSSNDVFTPQDSATLEELRLKHPSPSRPLVFPAPPSEPVECLVTLEADVQKSIFSFPNGSASGMDGLRQQVLKDLLGKENGEFGNSLLSSITKSGP